MSIPAPVRQQQQRLARWARRSPGYRWALEEILPRVRRSPVLTDLAWRVFAPRHGAGHVDVALLPDRQLVGPDVNRIPVVGVLATGLTDEQLESLVAEVVELQRQTGAFRPLLIADRPVFAAVRRHGYVLELLVDEPTWRQGRHGDQPWEVYLARRVAALVDHYQLWHLARTADGRLDRLDVAVLRELADRLPDLQVRVAP